MNIWSVFITLEVLFINLALLNRCCKRKYGIGVTIISLAAFTAFFLFSAGLLYSGFGDGKLAVGGFLYLIPLFLLYKEKISRLFIIMCMCWAFTMSIWALSIQIGRLITGNNLYFWIFIIQTVLYAIILYPFFKYIAPKYLAILYNLKKFDQNCGKYFDLVCFLHVIMVMILNLAFFQGSGSIMKVLAILLLSSITILSYAMLYRMVSDSIRIVQLQQTSRQDSLTGLANRACLFDDLRLLIEQKETFSILFMDLDRFKEINDRYGHMIGDQYLRHFATMCTKSFETKGKVYRFGGDEFVVLCEGRISPSAVEQIQLCRDWNKGAPCPFNQVSTGFLECSPPFPDAEQLIQQVDQNMYEMKIKKQRG